MPTLYIDSVTFGDWRVMRSDADMPRDDGREYEVSETLLQLFNNWRCGREPEQFMAGLIADAMDEEECEKDAVYHALREWMRGVFGGRINRSLVGDSWRSHHPSTIAAMKGK